MPSTIPNDIVSTDLLAPRTLERIGCAHNDRLSPGTGITSGLKSLDRVTLGFHPGDLVVLSSLPHQGRTALALQIAIHNAVQEQIPVLIFSQALERHRIMLRLIALESAVSLMEMRSGFWPRKHRLTIDKAAARLSKAPISVIDTPALTTADAAALAREHSDSLGQKNKRLGLIIVDDIDAFNAPTMSRQSADRLYATAMEWKKTAQNLQVPVLATARHMTFNQHRPMETDSLQSAVWARVADVLIYVYREPSPSLDSPEPANCAKLFCVKNVHGRESCVEVDFNRRCGRFSDQQ